MTTTDATQAANDERQLAEIVCRIGSIAKIDPEQDYFDAGLSSIQALELLMEIETVFSVSVSDEDFVKARSVRALQGVIASARSNNGESSASGGGRP